VSPAAFEELGDVLHAVDLSRSRGWTCSAQRAPDGHVAEPCLAVLSSELSRACAAAREQSGGDLYVLCVWVTCLCDSRACVTHG